MTESRVELLHAHSSRRRSAKEFAGLTGGEAIVIESFQDFNEEKTAHGP
jgi:hypothetical protein